jgi:hypothetical protein
VSHWLLELAPVLLLVLVLPQQWLQARARSNRMDQLLAATPVSLSRMVYPCTTLAPLAVIPEAACCFMWLDQHTH